MSTNATWLTSLKQSQCNLTLPVSESTLLGSLQRYWLGSIFYYHRGITALTYITHTPFLTVNQVLHFLCHMTVT